MIKYFLPPELQSLNLTMKIKRFDDVIISHLGKLSVKAGLAASGNACQLSSRHVFQITMDHEIIP